MALVTQLGVPNTPFGLPSRMGYFLMGSIGSAVTLDAVNEGCAMIGSIWTSDGASHVIDTTGLSSMAWRNNSLTLNNVGTTLKVGLASIDTTGPPARPVNVGGVMTMDVSRTYTGGSTGLSGIAFNNTVPDTGSKTIANGDLVAFCVQMTARGGTDTLAIAAEGVVVTNSAMPCVVSYIPSTWAAVAFLPNAVITFRDGATGYFVGGQIFESLVATAFNNASAQREYGNYFRLSVPIKIHGVAVSMAAAGNFEIVLYGNPTTSPSVLASLSVLATQVGLATNSILYYLFPTPVAIDAYQEFLIAIKPTSGTNVTLLGKTVSTTVHQDGDPGGTLVAGASRGASGAFTVLGTPTRYSIGPLLASFEHPARSEYVLGM